MGSQDSRGGWLARTESQEGQTEEPERTGPCNGGLE